MPVDYAELHALSAFSFRRSVALPGELVRQAAALGYRALAITDECAMAGIVRAHEAARSCEISLIVGTEIVSEEGVHLILLAPGKTAYAQLCRLVTRARRRCGKGDYRVSAEDLASGLDEVLAIWKPGRTGARELAVDGTMAGQAAAEWLRTLFDTRLWLGATRQLSAGETGWFDTIERIGRHHGIPRVACGDVRMVERSQRPLLDVLTALEAGRPVAECGLNLAANGERHLRPRSTLARLYPAEWLEETLRLAERCHFSLDELDYRYPRELAPDGRSAAAHLRQLTLAGMQKRYGEHPPDRVRSLVARELDLIEDMGVESFFLTVEDAVRFARSRGILCQGRGSAANSAVCYCLGITEVDPSKQQLLFERFISKERNEPPDIDVDFEHERREEVLQYIYEKYGRERAALAATVISYRPKSALKDVGRALGLDALKMNRLTASLAWWDQPDSWPERLRECGFDPDAPAIRHLMTLTLQLVGLPRHLSQHVGGMVISDTPLHHLVPTENAAMADRTIIQWDKDDLETLGLLKVDCLALGMLTVIRKAIDLVNGLADHGEKVKGEKVKGQKQHAPPPFTLDLLPFTSNPLSLATIPREDTATYDMLCAGDAIGVFQVESRAQMAMLPRLRPRCFYDLVIEVAIVRPGPIQGDMVHPYLARRSHPEQVEYPSPELKSVLERTLGVPIFQEQVMQIAIVAAGFTPGEADQLRRAMAAWKRRGGLEPFRDKLVAGMRRRGYDEAFAERLYRQICGFGDYGFPESHAASFALLTYFSAWLKCHHPAAFACALLNSQSMGFYAPAQIINDARRHGVKVLPVDVCRSRWDCTLQQKSHERVPTAGRGPIRLGLRQVRGFDEAAAERIALARAERMFRDIQDLVERADLDRRQVRALADAGALKGLAGHRHRARWEALATRRQGDLLEHAVIAEPRLPLRPPGRQDDLLDDYASLGLSLEHHPVALLRSRLPRRLCQAEALADMADGSRIEVAGLVTHRQRPGTASGVIFLSLEDETGIINVIVWPKVAERYRRAVLTGHMLRVAGKLQNAEGSQHLIAERIHLEDHHLARLSTRSRDFC
ncbi:error-prone DNA polymerase [Wenzhouxiangella sp. AB-CW3]|uniref:error-prone DNA polymerase n=1 Tax=Wenzhouxiangella sp. AB-CW3 TaxID=2771012 RepID=UPI00168B1623|nr:error-prone DNA polymerase [Wenzhouxiangella sp. AB-CW3]QOC21617.1 error-prone DNA polymerase [Wenzhouxiangella sp. AB-CW3]